MAQSCGFCGSSEYSLLFPTGKKNNAMEEYRVVRCRQCELVRTTPLPNDAELAEIFAQYEQDDLFYQSTGDLNRSFSGRLKQKIKALIIKTQLNMIYPYAIGPRAHADPFHILDVGCGAGGFLNTIKQSEPKWKLYGCELFPEAAEKAKSIPGSEIRAQELIDCQWPANYFHAVCFWDVFEHLANPAAVITEVERILAPGGFVYFHLPNFNSYWSRAYKRYWWQLIIPQHFYHYSPQSLTKVCESAGLKVRAVHGPRMRVNPHWNISVWLDHYKKEPNAKRWKIRFYEIFCRLCMQLDRVRLLPAASMYLAAEK